MRVTRERIEQLARCVGSGREQLIPVLQAVQDEEGYLSAEALAAVAQQLGVSEAEVTGVATFTGSSVSAWSVGTPSRCVSARLVM